MRMRELEKKTGVGRETIRFYIREGLLPEPERASANSASYRDEHVTRLRIIKRLQEERFLPLAIIKSLLNAEDSDRWLHAGAFPDLDAMLRARLDSGGEGMTLVDLSTHCGCPLDELEEAVARGMISIGADGLVGPRDVAIGQCLGDLRAIGFTEARGFDGGPDMIDMYVEFVRWLVGQEMRLFFEHTAGDVGEDQVLDMAERGISSVNEMLGLMRTREILRQLEARRKIANDNIG